MNKKTLLVSVSVALMLLLFFAAASYYESSERQRVGDLAEDNAALLVRDYSPRMGPENAKVSLVEFLDPECESCRAFYPFVKEIMADHKDDLALVVRYAPFHQNSRFAIKILEAARRQGKYWETLELLFAYQPYWASHHDPKPDLIWTYLPQIGLDIEKIKNDMNDPEVDKHIDQDVMDGVALGVQATPTFFINGEPLEEFGTEPLLEQIQRALRAPNDQDP